MTVNKKLLLEMLQYKRPEGTVTQTLFCERYLEPVMGEPDGYGNYEYIVYNEDGSLPDLCFTSHHDTVHKTEGIQKVIYDTYLEVVYTEGSNCLGADCTTGVWLMLGMMEAQVPGIYVVHAGEEIGCVGSSGLIKDFPNWLNHVGAVISFDRFGTSSVITHQMGMRTASDAFAESFASAVGLDLSPDPGGSYTDSNEYAPFVSECTNISVGYYSQHTAKETQDMDYAEQLLDALITADWSKIVIERDPTISEYDWGGRHREPQTVQDVVYEYPDEIAELLCHWGYKPDDLLEDLGYLRGPSMEYIG